MIEGWHFVGQVDVMEAVMRKRPIHRLVSVQRHQNGSSASVTRDLVGGDHIASIGVLHVAPALYPHGNPMFLHLRVSFRSLANTRPPRRVSGAFRRNAVQCYTGSHWIIERILS